MNALNCLHDVTVESSRDNSAIFLHDVLSAINGTRVVVSARSDSK